MPPDSISSTNNPIPPRTPVQKQQIWKPLSIVFISLSALLAIVATFLIVRFINTSGPKEPDTLGREDCPTSCPSEILTSPTSLDSTEELRRLITGLRYPASPDQPFYGEISLSAYGTLFAPEGYNFAVRPSLAYSFEIKSSNNKPANTEQNLSTIISYFNNRGFSVADYSGINTDLYDLSKLARKDDLLCFITNDSKDSPLTVDCADIDWYTERANQMLPFAESYKEDLGGWPAFVDAYDLDVVVFDSIVSPYQTAHLRGYSGALYFYRTDPSSRWRLFTETQNPIYCEKYNTPDLINAYKGTPCRHADDDDDEPPSKVGS